MELCLAVHPGHKWLYDCLALDIIGPGVMGMWGGGTLSIISETALDYYMNAEASE